METQKALSLAAGLCSKKEYCCKDILEKLKKWEVSPKESQQIITWLIEHKFIDEKRFTTFYTRDKFRFNKWGKLKIIQMLKNKGISSDVIQEAMDELNQNDYSDTCLALLKQKKESLKEKNNYIIKAKLIRFALSKGFDYDTINFCLHTLSIPDAEDSSDSPA